jgi:hypothetical protein
MWRGKFSTELGTILPVLPVFIFEAKYPVIRNFYQ